jgi:hypothetical protein
MYLHSVLFLESLCLAAQQDDVSYPHLPKSNLCTMR